MPIPDNEQLLARIKHDYRRSDDHLSEWRIEARELYDIVAGHQWDAADAAVMRDELRPMVTFNVAGKFLDAVSGLQINNRQQIKFFPREQGDVRVNEILTGAADWVRDQCDAEDEETDAFIDLLVCGMGATETSISFDEDPEGKITVERRDPLEMHVDPRARKRNCSDARWIMRIPLMTEQQIVDRWGQDKYDQIVGTSEFRDGYDDMHPHHADDAWKYEHDMRWASGSTHDVAVAHYEWWERADQYEVQTQYGKRTFTKQQWAEWQPVLTTKRVKYQMRKVRAKRYFRAFIAGETVLEKGESPYQEGFTLKLITGKRDRNTNTWYGIGRAIRDPQLWTNKFFSEILHVLNSNAKGGVVAEEDAFSDPRKAERDWNRPNSFVFTESGAISGEKIMPKPTAQYPAGMDKLMTFSLQALPETSGLNLELIGLADRVQPGIVEAHRKQAAMTVIAWAFDAMRRYYKSHGRCLAYYIREYISDGRLVRILGQDGNERYIPLVKDQLTYEYDVIVDESPSSPNMKERVWAVLVEMMPALMKAGMPIPPETLDYSPLPADLVDKWKRMLTNPEAQKAKQAQQQAMQEGMQAKTDEMKASAQDKQAAAQEKQSQVVLNFAQAQKAHADAGKTAGGG